MANSFPPPKGDPRLLVLTVVCFVFTAIQVWDVRLMLVLAGIALVYYRSAGIPFRAVRRQWAFVIFFVTLLVLVNGVIAGGQVPRIPSDQLHVYLRLRSSGRRSRPNRSCMRWPS